MFIDYTEMNSEMSKRVLECRNLPEIRKWMVDTVPISLDNHTKFLKNLRNTQGKFYYCIIFNDKFIGSINIIKETDDTVERGIYIHPDFWGKKLSVQICKQFYSYIAMNMGIKSIITKVLKNNHSSNALEKALGTHQIAEDEWFYYYKYNI